MLDGISSLGKDFFFPLFSLPRKKGLFLFWWLFSYFSFLNYIKALARFLFFFLWIANSDSLAIGHNNNLRIQPFFSQPDVTDGIILFFSPFVKNQSGNEKQVSDLRTWSFSASDPFWKNGNKNEEFITFFFHGEELCSRRMRKMTIRVLGGFFPRWVVAAFRLTRFSTNLNFTFRSHKYITRGTCICNSQLV